MRTTLFAKVLIALSFTLCLTGCPKPEAAANADQQASQQSRLAQMLGFGKKSDPAPAATAVEPAAAPASVNEAPLPTVQIPSIPEDNMLLAGTLQQAGKNNPKAEKGVDYDTFAFPVTNGKTNPDGYPIYLISCDDNGQCISWGNRPVGSIDDVAAVITTIRNKDVISGNYRCDKLCWDKDEHIVGAPSEAMVTWLKTHPQS